MPCLRPCPFLPPCQPRDKVTVPKWRAVFHSPGVRSAAVCRSSPRPARPSSKGSGRCTSRSSSSGVFQGLDAAAPGHDKCSQRNPEATRRGHSSPYHQGETRCRDKSRSWHTAGHCRSGYSHTQASQKRAGRWLWLLQSWCWRVQFHKTDQRYCRRQPRRPLPSRRRVGSNVSYSFMSEGSEDCRRIAISTHPVCNNTPLGRPLCGIAFSPRENSRQSTWPFLRFEV